MSFFISFLSGVIFFYSFQYFPFSMVFLSSLVALGLILKKRWFLIPVIVLGVFYAFLRYSPEYDYSSIKGKEMIVSGAFDSKPVETSYGKFIQKFHVDSAIDPETEEPLEELDDDELGVVSDDEFEIGDRYELLLKPGKDSTRLNPGGMPDSNTYAHLIQVNEAQEDNKSFFSIFSIMRTELNTYITSNFSPDSAALITAITTGQRSEMSEELRNAFNSTGLAHMLSISGTHFGLFSVFLFGIFRFLIKHLPYRILQWITIYLTPSEGAAILCAPFMAAYLGLAGWSIPAARSFIMISLFLLGLLISRKGFWLNSLLFAAFIIVLWSPDAISSLSFQLSFVAVLFIGFSVGYMEEGKESSEEQKSGSAEAYNFISRFLTPVLHIFRTSILISLAASLGTALLVAHYFHYFSIISPLSNLIITPLIGFVLLPLSLMSAFIFLITGNYIFAPLINAVSELAVYLIMSFSRIPFADIKIPAFPVIILMIFYLLVAVYFFIGRKRYILAIASVLVVISIALPLVSKKQNISITYLDAGQGDSAVVELPDRKIVLVDTGRSGREADAFLKYRGRRTIDVLVLSHSHPDHTGGADYLLRNFRVKELWDNSRLAYEEGFLNGINKRTIERGDVIEGKGYKIYGLHPYKEFYSMDGDDYTEDNNSSVVLKIEGKDRSFLFAGDVEEEAEENISHLGKWLKSDVIKVPHHGSGTSASEWFLNTVKPQIAVISAGRDNSFGHPHQETLDMLGNIKIYRTDIDGAIKITEKDSGFEIKTFKDFQFAKAKSFTDEIRNFKRLFEVW